jgi:spore coat protein SA
MKIAAIMPEIEPFSNVGGAMSRWAYETFKRFSTDVDVTTVFSRPVLRHPFPDRKIRIQTIYSGFYSMVPGAEPFMRRRFLGEVSRKLRGRFDAVLIYNRPDYIPAIRTVDRGVKIALVLGNDHLITGRPREVCRNAARSCDLIIGCSNYVCNGIRAAFPEVGSKLVTLYFGVDTKVFHPDENAGVSEKSMGGKTVLFVGRLVEEKGVHLLIEAMKIVFKEMPAAKLIIVGSAWFGSNKRTDYVRHLRQLAVGSQDRISFTGYVRGDRVGEIYRNAAVFVSPSVWNEPFGNMNLEAMASGLAVITSNRGGIPEAVGDAAILVEPENVGLMAEKIIYFLTHDDSRREWGRKARTRAERFSWDTLAPLNEQAIRRLL